MGSKTCIIIPDRGDRPKFLRFLYQQYSRFNVKPFVYLINHRPVSSEPDLVARIKKGVEMAKSGGYEFVFILENDDYYPASYFDDVPDNVDVVGETRTIYYHLKDKRWEITHHPGHSSLFVTGFRISALDGFEWPKFSERFLDVSLWKHFRKQKLKEYIHYSGAIGMKHGIGLCGGKGHRQWFMNDDSSQEWLKSMIDKEAFEFYSNPHKWQ